jgi:hypothetical protein
VDERIAEPALARIEQLALALVARGGIEGDGGAKLWAGHHDRARRDPERTVRPCGDRVRL